MGNNTFEPFVKAIAVTAEHTNALNPGDYQGEDGRWYCGKCRTPKQAEVYIGGKRPFCDCQCAADEFNRKRETDERRRRAQAALSNAFDESEMLKWTFANDDGKTPEYTRAARNYCDHFEEFRRVGQGLLIWSEQTGNGKSWMAAMIVNELCSRGISCRMTSFGQILADLRGTFSERDYMDRLMSHSLLVLDDLGAERDTSYAEEKVFNVIDRRVNSGKPMIITTNLPIETLKNAPTEEARRIYSRTLKCCAPIPFKGCDRRKVIAAEKYSTVMEILGL